MLKNDAVNNHPFTLQPQHARAVEIANALPMHLQTLDLARHTIIDPDGNRYVVATFDDCHLGRGYVTAIYPQQNDYLTLVRLTIAEFSSPTPEEAIQRHITVAQALQQGRVKEFSKTV